MSKINELIQARGHGKTQSMLEGWAPGTLVIAADEQHARYLRARLPKGADVRGLESADLLGLHCPILVDHYVYEAEIERRGRELRVAYEKISKLERRIDELFTRNVIKESEK